MFAGKSAAPSNVGLSVICLQIKISSRIIYKQIAVRDWIGWHCPVFQRGQSYVDHKDKKTPPSDFATFVWKNRAPPWIQFFTWLLVQEPIQCMSNLVKKHIQCRCGMEEDSNHIIFGCSFAAQVWSSLHIDTSRSTVRGLWTVPRPTTVPAKHFGRFLLLVCWMVWSSQGSPRSTGSSGTHARRKRISRVAACRWPIAKSPKKAGVSSFLQM